MNFIDFDEKIHDLNRTMEYIKDVDADIVCIQEYSLAGDCEKDPKMEASLKGLRKQYPYRTSGYHDLAIYSKKLYSVLSSKLNTNVFEKDRSYK